MPFCMLPTCLQLFFEQEDIIGACTLPFSFKKTLTHIPIEPPMSFSGLGKFLISFVIGEIRALPGTLFLVHFYFLLYVWQVNNTIFQGVMQYAQIVFCFHHHLSGTVYTLTGRWGGSSCIFNFMSVKYIGSGFFWTLVHFLSSHS